MGGLILFIGISFLLKYASDNSMLSPSFRISGILIFGISLVGLGFKLREREGQYGIILQGIGIGILYAGLFASGKMYGLISMGTTFLLLVIRSIVLSILSVKQNAKSLAVVSAVGAFATPILCSTNSGSHSSLFAYYAAVNIGLFIIAWFKQWRLLNLIGFYSTYLIGTAWGILKYRPSGLWSTEPFVIFFFFLFLIIGILFASKIKYNAKGAVDGSKTFGIQTQLLENVEYGLVYTAVVLASLYITLWFIFNPKPNYSRLAQSYLYLGIVFYTIAIPLLFNDKITSVLWVVESVAIIWISLAQKRIKTHYCAIALQGVGALAFYNSIHDTLVEDAFVNTLFLNQLIVVGSLLLTAFVHFKYRDNSNLEKFEKIFFYLKLTAFTYSGILQTVENQLYPNGLMIYFSVGIMIIWYAANNVKWTTVNKFLEICFLISLLLSLSHFEWSSKYHPLNNWGVLSFGLMFFLNYFLLFKASSAWKFGKIIHCYLLILMLLVVSWEFNYFSQYLGFNFENSFVLFWVPSLITAFILFKGYLLNSKHLIKFKHEYQTSTLKHLLFGLGFAAVFINLSDAEINNFYLPVLNLIEIFQIAYLLLLVKVIKDYNVKNPDTFSKKWNYFLGAFMLLLASVLWARMVHEYFDISYDVVRLSKSPVFQTGISILWTLIATWLMLFAKSKVNRLAWIIGASLLGVVVLKLFLIDLSKVGVVARIVSFIGVGVILLGIGYFAPLPPQKQKRPK